MADTTHPQEAETYKKERAALNAVLASRSFLHAPGLSRMLSYLCERYFLGQTDAIKEYSIAVDALGRGDDFQPSKDSIVRVQASRLRAHLRRFYQEEGADFRMRIELPETGYTPQFVRQAAGRAESPPAETPPELEPPSGTVPETRRGLRWPGVWIAAALLTVAAFGSLIGWHQVASGPARKAKVVSGTDASGAQPAVPAGPGVRILPGFSGQQYIDQLGAVWLGDRYFTGGTTFTRPEHPITRTPDPAIYRSGRQGEFRYDIPLAAGTYELDLHFAEIFFGQALSPTTGEAERWINVTANGTALLSRFDVLSDAGGPNLADERVFKDISPAADGYLHLAFGSLRGGALLNGLEILPSEPGRARPIRILAGTRFFSDRDGNLWRPNRYVLGGNGMNLPNPATGASDPGIYASQRWGAMTYTIPVPPGTYNLTLRFAEPYFGAPAVTAISPLGARLFDVYCNGSTLLKDFDIYREAGGTNRQVDRTFKGLRPNSQGKLAISFVPVKTYPCVNAIEVVDASR